MFGFMMTINRTAAARLWKRYKSSNIKQIVKLVVLVACSILVFVQLFECFSKLISPPITSHTSMQINSTVIFPAITICRSPAYKTHVLEKYNLGRNIRWTSEWAKFPFENVTLQQFFDEASYSFEETVSTYGINYAKDNLTVRSSQYFVNGRCHTLIPLYPVMNTGNNVGYAVTLNHRDVTNPTADSKQACENGFQISIHPIDEVWTEDTSSNTAQIETLCLERGQELHVKLSVDEFQKIDRESNRCNPLQNYSESRCEDVCHWKEIAQRVGCSAPWMPDIDMPHCNNYTSTVLLIRDYINSAWDTSKCHCSRPCYTLLFRPQVMNRHTMVDTPYLSQLYVFYDNRVISVKERYSYDWSLFVSDLGGSLGFLLGLSVIGIINLLERFLELAVGFVEEKSTTAENIKENKQNKDIDSMKLAIVSEKI